MIPTERRRLALLDELAGLIRCALAHGAGEAVWQHEPPPNASIRELVRAIEMVEEAICKQTN